MLSISHISKTFGKQVAVRDLSFEVMPGEIFGLLGPNGAGKTTSIRMMLDLLKPDGGTIEVFGGVMDEHKKDRIGYMPEERGLYGSMKLAQCLTYLGTLKNLPQKESAARVEAALKRLELWEHRNKKIEKLSRGMTQKAQVIAATVHQPDLLIIDEPFANLDPVNAQLIRDILFEMRAQGKSVIMSSHQMHLVEELCDRILLIYQGIPVIYSTVREAKLKFAGRDVLVAGQGNFDHLPGVLTQTHTEHGLRLTLADAASPNDVFRALAARSDVTVEKFELALPSLDEVFIRAVKGLEN